MDHPHEMTATLKKRIVLTVINDIATDNRVQKVAYTLNNMGFEVTIAGRILPQSLPLTAGHFKYRRFRFLINKGPLFYALFNIRLFFYLLSSSFDLLCANDLDTLPAAWLAGKIRRLPLVYDSHELFTELPELIERPSTQKIWKSIESSIVPRLKNCYTVCDSIAQYYRQEYGTSFKVVRNLPLKVDGKNEEIKEQPFAVEQPFLLYQGAVNLGRGVEEAILAMHELPDLQLVIAGDGDQLKACRQLVSEQQLTRRVIFTGRLAYPELKKITRRALIGLSLEKDLGLNYRYALPNKLFDYIQAGVPVLATDLPEMSKIIKQYDVGHTISSSTPQNIVQGIRYMLEANDQFAEWKKNCLAAGQRLCWEEEEKILKGIYNGYL